MRKNNAYPDTLDCKTSLSFPTNSCCSVIVSRKGNVATGKGKWCGLFFGLAFLLKL